MNSPKSLGVPIFGFGPSKRETDDPRRPTEEITLTLPVHFPVIMPFVGALTSTVTPTVANSKFPPARVLTCRYTTNELVRAKRRNIRITSNIGFLDTKHVHMTTSTGEPRR